MNQLINLLIHKLINLLIAATLANETCNEYLYIATKYELCTNMRRQKMNTETLTTRSIKLKHSMLQLLISMPSILFYYSHSCNELLVVLLGACVGGMGWVDKSLARAPFFIDALILGRRKQITQKRSIKPQININETSAQYESVNGTHQRSI